MPTSASPRPPGLFAVSATALLTGLAGGALCCLLALALKSEPSWLMLPFAAAVGGLFRWQAFSGARGATAAAAAMLICLIYTEYLYAAVRMADTLGFPLRDTLFKMDFGLAWQMIRANLSWFGALMFLASPALAAGIVAAWPMQPRPRAASTADNSARVR